MGIASVIDKPMASPVGNLPETSAGIPNAAPNEMSNFIPDTVTPVSRSDDIFEGLPCHRCEVNFSLTHRNPRESVPLGDLAYCSLHPTTTDLSQEPASPSCRPNPDIPAHSVQRLVPREKIDVSPGDEPLEMIPERKEFSSYSHKRSRLEEKPGIRNSHVNTGTYLQSFIACSSSIREEDGGPNLYENNSHPLLGKCSRNPQTRASLWRSQERLDMNLPSNGNHEICPEDTSNRIEADQWVLSPLLKDISTEAPSSEICVQEDSFEHTIARRLLDECCGNPSPRGINACDGVPSEEEDIEKVSPPPGRSPSQEPESVPESRRASRCLTPDSLIDYHAWRRRGWISSHTLPFFSVSAVSTDDDMEERGLPVPQPTILGPSAYIPPDELPPLGTFNEQTHLLFVDAFLQNNRLDHVTQVMGYHPTYLDIFLRTQNFILRGDGPLPYDYRHFIAIMAAGRHQCSYLINLQKQEFLLQGGDQTWLKGLSKIPQKLRDLYDINKILAHRPWLLNKSHIEKLTKGKDSWSLAEVVHAIVLLAHFHSLASFVFGCGVNEELDHEGGHQHRLNMASSNPAGMLSSSPRTIPTPVSDKEDPWVTKLPSVSPSDQEVGVETLMQRMKSLSERSEEFSQEEKVKRFEHVESQSAELSSGLEPLTQVKADIGQFVDDPTFLYQDFARRGEVSDIPTFRVQDYSWDDHGYSLVNRLYNDVGNLLDEKFKTAYNLTYYTMGGLKDVDTSRFRRAIWNYIQCMFGIRHDDYDYGEVNQLLERSLKAFIKMTCCYPERVTKKDYDRVLREFKHSEKVHVNLMVLEARMQAELLYALRAVMRYMT